MPSTSIYDMLSELIHKHLAFTMLGSGVLVCEAYTVNLALLE